MYSTHGGLSGGLLDLGLLSLTAQASGHPESPHPDYRISILCYLYSGILQGIVVSSRNSPPAHNFYYSKSRSSYVFHPWLVQPKHVAATGFAKIKVVC